MGGRGGAGGVGAGRNANTPQYREAYNIEMENARSFEAAFAIEEGVTKDSIGYQMYVHQDVTGRSLIADTRKDIEFLRSELRQANQMGRSYGMSQASIDGMKAGIREKIALQERAISAMESARSEYERFKRQASVGNERSRRRGGRWM